jgi:hypothetical protein
MKSVYSCIKILGTISIVTFLGVGCIKISVPPTDTAVKNSNLENGNINSAPAVAAISDATLKNMGYPVNGFPGLATITLKDGEAEFIGRQGEKNGFARLNLIERGDVDGDGLEDAMVVVRINTGGSGVWPLVFVVLNDQGRAVPRQGVTFEDRSDVHSITIDDTYIIVNVTIHGSSDAMCCPTLNKNEYYRWYYDKLELLKSPSDAAIKAYTDFSEYLPITAEAVSGQGMNHPPDQTYIYRNGILMFIVAPQYPEGFSKDRAGKEYNWEISMTPVPNGDIKATLNIRPEKFLVSSIGVPKVALGENKNDTGAIWFEVGNERFVYSISDREFTLLGGSP